MYNVRNSESRYMLELIETKYHRETTPEHIIYQAGTFTRHYPPPFIHLFKSLTVDTLQGS